MFSASAAGRASLAAMVAPCLVAPCLFAGAAFAGDCNSDVAGLSQKRQVWIDKLNVLAKASKGKLDPVASCPTLRGLVKAEGELLKYLEANKNWCNVPDDAVANLKAADAKSQTFQTQACNLAEQVKKQKQQQAASNASLLADQQKLPSGPL